MKANTSLLPFLAVLLAAPAGLFASSLAERLAEATGLEPIKVTAPSIPSPLLEAGLTEGLAQVRLEVASDGSVQDVFVIGSTEPRLAEAVSAAVRQWRFQPADASVVHQIQLNLHLSVTGFSIAPVQTMLAQRDPARFRYHPTRLEALDQPLELRFARSPAYPDAWKAEGLAGRVEVSYYVDASGRVRVPTIADAVDARLASAVIEALQEWRFEPPTASGRPAFVHVRQSFDFGHPATSLVPGMDVARR